MNRVSLAQTVLDYYKYDKITIVPKETIDLNQAAMRPLRGGFISMKFLKEFPTFRFTSVLEYLQNK